MSENHKLRSLIVYFQLLVLPLVFLILWLLIPIQQSYLMWCIFFGIYAEFAIFNTSVYFSFIVPRFSFKLLFFILTFGLVVIILGQYWGYYYHQENNRMLYLAIMTITNTSIPIIVLIHALITAKKCSINGEDDLAFSSKLARWLFYSKEEKKIARQSLHAQLSLLEQDYYEFVDEQERQEGEEEEREEGEGEEEGGEREERRERVREERRERRREFLAEELKPTGRDKCMIRASLFAMLWQVTFSLTWLFLNFFTNFFAAHHHEYPTLFSLVFQFSMTLLPQVCRIVNKFVAREAVDSGSVMYTTDFVVQFLFLFYYRNLFLEVNSWSTTIAMGFISLGFTAVYFPLRATKFFYNFYSKLQGAIFRVFGIDFKVDTYETYVKEISVSLYFKTVAEIYSMITFSLCLIYIRNSYIKSMYPTFTDPAVKFEALMWKYLFLFVLEVVAIQAMKMFMKRYMKIDFRQIVKDATINQYKNRFMFSIWLTHIIHDVYFSLCVMNY